MKRLIIATLVFALACSSVFAASSKSKAKPKTATSKKKAAPTAAKPQGPALVGLEVEPKEVTLVGPRAVQRLVAVAKFSDGSEKDVTSQVKFTSAAKFIVIDKDAIVSSKDDGTAPVRAELGGKAVTIAVTARDTTKAVPVNFQKEVVPVMVKAGCNQGACHGAQYGKGGFKTSLFGYEPEIDYKAIVKVAEGRRVVLSEPEQSLILLKPTMQVPHGGGLRFEKDSWQYRIFKQWLEDGAPGLPAKPPLVSKVEVFPATRLMHAGDQQRLVVRATWSDGSVEDITQKAIMSSNSEGVVAVNNAIAEAKNPGGTAIMVRYMGAASVAAIDVPYPPSPQPLSRSQNPAKSLPGQAGEGQGARAFAEYNFIDKYVVEKWKRLGLIPSKDCDDYEFIRRVYIDAIGVLPAPDAIRKFAADKEPDKRKQLIDEVLNRPEYADQWTMKWADLLRNNSDKLNPKGMWSFHLWIRAQMRDNKPLDQFVRELLTAQGSTFSNGPANFFRVAANAPDRAEAVAQTLLGIRMQCAKCHHHPFEKWSQDDYYQLAAFFARVGQKGSQEFGLFGGEQIIVVQAGGEVTHPKTGRVMKPTPPDGEPLDDPIDRRRPFASWLTSADNMMFARNLVNRFWGYTMGRGLVEAIDDMRATNPPSNPALLDALAKEFIAKKFDQKQLLRIILNSHVYQLSSEATMENKRDETFYSHYLLRRLTAEQLFDAINDATETKDKFNFQQGGGLPLGTRAMQLPDPTVVSFFLDTFGRASRIINCECERSVEPNMTQALHLMNSDFIQNKLTNANGRLQRLLKEKKSDREIIEELYLVTFSRPPLDDEYEIGTEIITKAPSRKEGVEDLLWSLLNSREFLFNH